MKLPDELKDILPIIHCPEFDSNIYHLFVQLPQVDKLKKSFESTIQSNIRIDFSAHTDCS